MLNDGDGYWGGGHNFYIYDYAGKGYRWLLDDADATFAWLGRSDVNPIYWWAGRTSQQEAGQHYLIVMADPTWRANYLAAIRAQLARWDVARVQGWIDTWSAQIADAVAQDPHRLHSLEDHREALAAMRAGGRRSAGLRREVPRLRGRQRRRQRRGRRRFRVVQRLRRRQPGRQPGRRRDLRQRHRRQLQPPRRRRQTAAPQCRTPGRSTSLSRLRERVGVRASLASGSPQRRRADATSGTRSMNASARPTPPQGSSPAPGAGRRCPRSPPTGGAVGSRRRGSRGSRRPCARAGTARAPGKQRARRSRRSTAWRGRGTRAPRGPRFACASASSRRTSRVP